MIQSSNFANTRSRCLSLFSIIALFTFGAASGWAAERTESPDGKVVVQFSLKAGGVPTYTIDYDGKPIVLESRLGVEPGFTNGFRLIKTTENQHAGTWTNAFGERRIVPDNFSELAVDLESASGQRMRLTFRVYDEGAAFRYSFPGSTTNEFHFTGEHSEFCFPANTFGYEEHSTEGEYSRVSVAEIQAQCEWPLTLEYASGVYAGLGEADDENYPRMLLSPLPNAPGTLVSALGGTTSNTVRPAGSMKNNPASVLHGEDSRPYPLPWP